MFRFYVHLLWLAITANLVYAQSQIKVNAFVDNNCNVASTTSPNISVTLDACVVTVGMQAFEFVTTPCGNGGLTSVRAFGFSDRTCVNQWNEYYTSYDDGNGCIGAIYAGNAFGSIMLTCRENDGSPPAVLAGTSTVSVGPVVTGATATSPATSSSSGSSNSGNSNSNSSSNSSDTCSNWWACRSTGTKIGIIIGGIIVIIVVLSLLGCGPAVIFNRLSACFRRPSRPPPSELPVTTAPTNQPPKPVATSNISEMEAINPAPSRYNQHPGHGGFPYMPRPPSPPQPPISPVSPPLQPSRSPQQYPQYPSYELPPSQHPMHHGPTYELPPGQNLIGHQSPGYYSPPPGPPPPPTYQPPVDRPSSNGRL